MNTCAIEYYSTVKKNKIMKFVGKWMELEKIILSEVTQMQKDSAKYSLSSEAPRSKS